MAQWTIRLPDELAEQIRQAAKQRGFSSPRAFIRNAIRKELQGRGESADQPGRPRFPLRDDVLYGQRELPAGGAANGIPLKAVMELFFSGIPI
jgi:Arc/MetJ-type ribon-helix-helix transcriptional regulator